jgi:hypothetical protein
MSEIVRELTRLGWTPQKIGKELGMDADEVPNSLPIFCGVQPSRVSSRTISDMAWIW